MDTLLFRFLLLSERGGDSRFGTLPPWRELVKDELLIILSQCCFAQKLIVIPALRSLMHTTSAGDLSKIFPVNQKGPVTSHNIAGSETGHRWRRHSSASRPRNHPQVLVVDLGADEKP